MVERAVRTLFDFIPKAVPQAPDTYLTRPREVPGSNGQAICSALLANGSPCPRVAKEGQLCTLHANRKWDQERLVASLRREKQEKGIVDWMLPGWLAPYALATYPSNDVVIISSPKNAGQLRARFFGQFHGHAFTRKDVHWRNIRRILGLHDASHSVALFLDQMDTCDMAIHHVIPMVFPGTVEYTIFYTQKFNYPLVVTERAEPWEDLFAANRIPKAGTGRWCARQFKTNCAKWFYRRFDLRQVTQVLGMTAESPLRAKTMHKGTTESAMSTATFRVYDELPIFDWKLAQQRELMAKFGIPVNPIETEFNNHGCVFCPMRNEKWYLRLSVLYPSLYAQCLEFRKAGSASNTKLGKPEYFYFPNSKIM